MYYAVILDNIMEKWLGPRFDDDTSTTNVDAPYRMLALLLDDPWNEADRQRTFIVDITKPKIQRKLDMLNGPHFNTIMKMLELRMLDEDNERNNNRIENSSGTLV